MNSKWDTDRIFETRVDRFLEDQTSLLDDLKVITKIHSRDVQLYGIDYLAEDDEGKLSRMDFKAVATMLPTFAFEVEGNINTRQEGWMLKDNQTTHLALIYLDFVDDQGYYKNKTQLVNHETVKTVKVLLLDKVKLQKQIETWIQEDSNFKSVSEVCNTLRDKKTTKTQGYVFDSNKDLIERERWIKPYSFVVSGTNIYERPINCVIRRNFLEDFADKILVYET